MKINAKSCFHLTGAQNVWAIAETDGYRQRTITLHIDMPNEDSYFFVLFPKCQENCGERILKTLLCFIILYFSVLHMTWYLISNKSPFTFIFISDENKQLISLHYYGNIIFFFIKANAMLIAKPHTRCEFSSDWYIYLLFCMEFDGMK